MIDLLDLFERNRAWAGAIKARDPEFFANLSQQQSPQYLWIGCSDSRVPANQIVDMLPGEIFVHRNVANVVAHSDLNCLSVMQFAIDVLRVKHVIVCGHHSCGGVMAAMRGERHGLVDNWLRHVDDVRQRHQQALAEIADEVERGNRLSELNVIEQVVNVCRTTVVQDAWSRGQQLAVHGWVYGLDDGLLRDLGFGVTEVDEVESAYQMAVQQRATK
jgi:carbonic anhydrase